MGSVVRVSEHIVRVSERIVRVSEHVPVSFSSESFWRVYIINKLEVQENYYSQTTDVFY